MLIYSDDHMHSAFSADCKTSMKTMIESAINKGLKNMTFTEHVDFDYPGELNFLIDYDDYIPYFDKMKSIYKDQINLKLGVEVGLQHSCFDKINGLLSRYPFDFVLASTHVLLGMDPYDGNYYKGRSRNEAYATYFDTTKSLIESFDNFDSYGHLDYIIRYAPTEDRMYNYDELKDSLDALLLTIIRKNKALEVNTSGYRKGFHTPHPQSQVISRYYDLGGRLVTLGSDAHFAEDISDSFLLAYQLLDEIGFEEIVTFVKRQPEKIPIAKLLK